MLKRLLFRKEIKQIERILERDQKKTEADNFFIEQGRRVVQYQINNPDQKRIPRTLMGHGLQLGADHLSVSSQKWKRKYDHDMRCLLNKINTPTHTDTGDG